MELFTGLAVDHTAGWPRRLPWETVRGDAAELGDVVQLLVVEREG